MSVEQLVGPSYAPAMFEAFWFSVGFIGSLLVLDLFIGFMPWHR